MERKRKIDILSLAFAVIGLTCVFTGIGIGQLLFVGIGVIFFVAIWITQVLIK